MNFGLFYGNSYNQSAFTTRGNQARGAEHPQESRPGSSGALTRFQPSWSIAQSCESQKSQCDPSPFLPIHDFAYKLQLPGLARPGCGRTSFDEVIVQLYRPDGGQLRHRGGPPRTRGNPEEIPTAIEVNERGYAPSQPPMQLIPGSGATVQQKGNGVGVLLFRIALDATAESGKILRRAGLPFPFPSPAPRAPL